jgi:NADH dehydrogenase
MNPGLALPRSEHPRVVILGGGFGGIQLARRLRRKPLQVVLVDRHNYHTFQPLLYQVATGGLEPDSIAYPLRKIFAGQKNFFFRMAEALEIRPAENRVITSEGDVAYDYLVVATGGATHYFGLTNLQKHALPLKTVPDALDLRSLLLQNFEKAQTLGEHGGLLNVVVVGGGPTGVEVAGALGEFRRHVVPSDYAGLQPGNVNIWLVEAVDRLLGAFSEKSSESATRCLERLGVQVRLNTTVKDYDGEKATLGDGTVLHAACLVWSAGVKGSFPSGLGEHAAARGNRLKVDAFNRVEGHENVFAIGDAAFMTADTAWPAGHPMVAQPAIQQGRLLARNLERLLNKTPLTPFRYRDLGSLATVGRNKAVAEFGRLRFGGFTAWVLWLAIHLVSLVGFRNRIVVFVNWVWNYFSYDRAIRLIIRPYDRQKAAKPA